MKIKQVWITCADYPLDASIKSVCEAIDKHNGNVQQMVNNGAWITVSAIFTRKDDAAGWLKDFYKAEADAEFIDIGIDAFHVISL